VGAATPNKDRDQLLINKILSFGDQEFQMRCKKAMMQAIESGSVLVLVSDDSTVKLKNRADRVASFEGGQIRSIS
jgi:ABC-type polysaccharide/polyol phosphate transport system ATPase subunit